MQKQAQRNRAGAHRKTSVSHTTKGRAALLAVATSAVGTAGAAGTAVAHTSVDAAPAHSEATPQYELAADNAAPVIFDQAPQILEIAEFKPVLNLADQLSKAIQYNAERMAADEAARAPQVVKPAEGILTSPFGPRWGTFHSGIDIANSLGTPILAVEDGTVIDAGPASGYGQWVRIKHEDGTITVYGHMETIDVSVGQHVTAGTKIAGMGSRGFSTGVHLHFEVHPGGGSAVDPIPWLAARGISV
ncbi:M23 family metallopeptidase [Corynebacterium aquilae]|uniref:Membrane protein n=1 Tax=Corynebacterium aquilae DSM 44791 TaxID=1431546 RepID=A0A1L7CEY2_9CORY|nr:M23 family metallopeptidase [Corynebacterium aquilae]APT84333.1 membrane protein [Corynebacterium aquilae DSM 44791]